MKTEIVKPVLFNYVTEDAKLILNILRVAARLKEFRYNNETKEEFSEVLSEIFDNRDFLETVHAMCEDSKTPNAYLSQFAPVITEFWNKLPSLFKFLDMDDSELMDDYEHAKMIVPRRKKGEPCATEVFYVCCMLVLAAEMSDSYDDIFRFEERVVANGDLIEQLGISGGREEFESYLNMDNRLAGPFTGDLELLKTNVEKILRCAQDNGYGDFGFDCDDEYDELNIKELQAENEVLKQEIENLKTKLNDVEADYEQLKYDNQYLKQDLDSMTDHFNDANADNEDLKQEIENLKKTCQTTN